MIDKFYCMSSYLTFRYVAEKGYQWAEGIGPVFPADADAALKPVSCEEEIMEHISGFVKANYDSHSGLLLSGGIDSAIIASFLPRGSKVYTISFKAQGAVDESERASVYAELYGLKHKVVEVTWADYEEYLPQLMLNKKAPLHAVEVGLFRAAQAAAEDGINKLFIGNGADSNFGGMDKLLSKDWLFDDFIKRYTFVSPEKVLECPVSMNHIYERYRIGERIDYISFLKHVHGAGIIQAFENALSLAGCESFEPFESMSLSVPLDIERIRNGESKYLLRAIFKKRYPGLDIPAKIPFARPMDQWMKNWEGPRRPEFLKDSINDLSGDQRWLVYCLESFLDLFNL